MLSLNRSPVDRAWLSLGMATSHPEVLLYIKCSQKRVHHLRLLTRGNQGHHRQAQIRTKHSLRWLEVSHLVQESLQGMVIRHLGKTSNPAMKNRALEVEVVRNRRVEKIRPEL